MKIKHKHLEFNIGLVVLIPLALFFIAQFLNTSYAYYDYVLFCALGLIIIFSVYHGVIPGLLLSGALIFIYGSVIFYQLVLGYSQTWTLNYVWFGFYPISAFIGGNIHQIIEHQNHLLSQCENLTEKVVNIDDVTGFGNARELLRDLDREMSRSKRFKDPLTLMIVQIQYFEELLAIYGDEGTKLLRDLSSVIDKALRIEDLRFRLEDDLFALILPNTSPEDSLVVKNRILKILEDMSIADDSSLNRYKIEIKVGACEYKTEIPNPMAFKALALKELEYDV